MSGHRLRVFGLAGSLRRGSFNRRLLERAGSLGLAEVELDLFTGLGEIPHFSEDAEGDATPPEVHGMRQRMAEAEALFVATPEYNSSIPGVLKNALDWASRPPGQSVLKGKAAAVAGASAGRYGAVRAQEHIRMVLSAVGATVLDRELPVGRAHEAFAEDGSLLDAEL